MKSSRSDVVALDVKLAPSVPRPNEPTIPEQIWVWFKVSQSRQKGLYGLIGYHRPRIYGIRDIQRIVIGKLEWNCDIRNRGA
jgi:hypothetical protein